MLPLNIIFLHLLQVIGTGCLPPSFLIEDYGFQVKFLILVSFM